ncbi:MAG: efflux RND transporter permease subunit [Chloroflexi bacterium]|nr:efflux RND transporter permease subunit [Chloroflexota bacterium]
MIEKIFDYITRGSIKYKWVTILLSVLIMVAGVIAFSQLNQELIPKIEFPQTIVLGLSPGMDAETLLEEVTKPIENAVSGLEGVVNVETTTSDGLSLATIRNEFGEDQEEIQALIQGALDDLVYPEGMEIPQLLSFSLSDLPIASLSISAEDLTIAELKALVEDEIIPELEAISSVAAVNVRGGQELPSEVIVEIPEEETVSESVPETVVTEEPAAENSSATLLPESWIQAFAGQGITISSPADLLPEMVQGILANAPIMLQELTPEMLYEMSPETLAILPPEFFAQLPAEVMENLMSMANSSEEGLPLPESWIQTFAAQGQTVANTNDLNGEMVAGIVAYAPEMLAELTPEILLVLPLDAIGALPQELILSQAPEIQAQIIDRVAQATVPEENSDPNVLPLSWQAAGEGQGFPLNTVADITVETIQGMASVAPQIFDALSPDNLRLFTPELLAWLPGEFIAKLDIELQMELNEIALPMGGLGSLAVAVNAESASPEDLPVQWQAAGDAQGIALNTVYDLTSDVIQGIGQFAPEMFDLLSEDNLKLMDPEVLAFLPESYFSSLDTELQIELQAVIDAANVFVPTATITRVNGNPSIGLTVFQDKNANIVNVSHDIFDKLDEFEKIYPNLSVEIVFEQASFIEESIKGVTQEGSLGALFAVIIILIFLSGKIKGKYKLSWRSTLVTAASIPLSVFMAFALFKWLPIAIDPVLNPLVNWVDGVPVLGAAISAFASLFPKNITLNIMTLSGMTVAVGRVVDDSIVVLENIYRHIQRGDDQKLAVIKGTRDVSKAIFASTATTVVVFLPIGLMGGLVGEFFLPFGIAVTYALASSFLVAITLIPLLAFLFIRKEHLPEEVETPVQRAYTPALKWALNHKGSTIAIASVLLLGSVFLFGTRPQAFLPDFGDIRLTASVDLPDDYSMSETNDLTLEFEEALGNVDGLGAVMTEVGGSGGMEAFFLGGSINQSAASISMALEDPTQANEFTALLREEAVKVFGTDNVIVSSGSLSSQGFGGFALVAASEDFSNLEDFNQKAIDALNDVDGLANVSSNLASVNTYLRVDGESAIRFVGELETKDTLGVTTAAKEALESTAPSSVTISEGFESQQQSEGFADTFTAIGVSVVVVYIVMVMTFGSFIHPFTILFSLPLAIIGAAIALWITDSILGLSSLIGLMMLVGIVVTNAIVLVDRVQANVRDRKMEVYDALVEAGRTRLRPILMTAIAAILALVPLAIGLSDGAIIASELAIVVIGGLTTSTLLTLLIVPVMYSILDRFSKNEKKSDK